MEKFKGVDIRVLTEADLFNLQGRAPAPKTMPSPQMWEEPKPEPSITAEDVIDGAEVTKAIVFDEAPIPLEEDKAVLGIEAEPPEAKPADEQPTETGKKKRRKG